MAWNAPDGPQVLPVTYGVYAGDIVFRTSPHGVLAQLDNPTIVAFGIDDLDQAHRAGWSVVARGRARGGATRARQAVDPARHRALGSGHQKLVDWHFDQDDQRTTGQRSVRRLIPGE